MIDMHVNPIRKASCHCGGVEFELTLPNGIEDPRRCNCSICRMRCAIAASVVLKGLKITKGANLLTLYQFNTMTAKHYFCSRCGIYTRDLRAKSASDDSAEAASRRLGHANPAITERVYRRELEIVKPLR